MSQQVEIEFKTMLTAEEYQRLCTFYQRKAADFHTQTNTYFDTPTQQIKQQKSGLRIRQLANGGELTLKVPANQGLLEITDFLTTAQTNELLANETILTTGEVAQYLTRQQINVEDLQVFASLTTKRAEFRIPEGLLAIDESWYHGAHDFELELEVNDEAAGQQAFQQLLATLDLPYRPAKNKIIRAITHKQKTSEA